MASPPGPPQQLLLSSHSTCFMGFLFMVVKHDPAIESLSSNYENCQGNHQKDSITLSPLRGNVRHPWDPPTSRGDAGTRRPGKGRGDRPWTWRCPGAGGCTQHPRPPLVAPRDPPRPTPPLFLYLQLQSSARFCTQPLPCLQMAFQCQAYQEINSSRSDSC